ncbi:MAG: hypothetical protein ACHQF2_02395 [Flavobacteriales bacterium]
MDIWLTSDFTIESFPDWNCPFCRKGLLQLLRDKFTSNKLATGTYIFNGSLRCNTCHQQVNFKGVGEMQQVGHYPSLSDYFHEEERVVYTPRHFHPAIPIFKLPANCPNEIKTELHNCLELYWVDLVLCVNKIQTILELLLSHQPHHESNLQKDRKMFVQLSTPIAGLIHLYPDLATDFLSLKWIENQKKRYQ